MAVNVYDFLAGHYLIYVYFSACHTVFNLLYRCLVRKRGLASVKRFVIVVELFALLGGHLVEIVLDLLRFPRNRSRQLGF